jgi:hypothetical protein
MGSERPEFNVRRLGNDGYVIDACWPDGRIEQLIGVYVSELFAWRDIPNLKLKIPGGVMYQAAE